MNNNKSTVAGEGNAPRVTEQEVQRREQEATLNDFPLTDESDFQVDGGGTVYLLRPLNETARKHIEGNVQEDAQWFGGAVVVEHRYIADLVAQLREEGFTVR